MNNISLKAATDIDFEKLEGTRIKTIKTDGNNSAITDSSLKSIATISGLEELDLEWAAQITDEGLEQLHRMLSLKYLDISFCGRISLEAIEKLAKAIPGLEIDR